MNREQENPNYTSQSKGGKNRSNVAFTEILLAEHNEHPFPGDEQIPSSRSDYALWEELSCPLFSVGTPSMAAVE